MATVNLNKSSRMQRNANISKGLRASCANFTIPIRGSLVRASAVAKVFEEAIEAQKRVTRARAQYLAMVEEARAAEAKVKPMIQPIKSFVLNAFGDRSEVTASFGFTPRKAAKVTAEVRAEAVQKLRATRAARHTVGSRKRSMVHCHVESPEPAPGVQPSTVPQSLGRTSD